jgi:phage virion morphogenesis protein
MSADDLEPLNARLAVLMARLGEGERRVLGRRIGILIGRSNRKRIAAQQNPDGSPFEPRRPKDLGGKKGGIRRKAAGAMFRRLRTPKFLRTQSDADQVELGFAGAAARIAGVHHHGLRDRVSNRPGAPEATYPQRRLLGLDEADREAILDEAFRHLESG